MGSQRIGACEIRLRWAATAWGWRSVVSRRSSLAIAEGAIACARFSRRQVALCCHRLICASGTASISDAVRQQATLSIILYSLRFIGNLRSA